MLALLFGLALAAADDAPRFEAQVIDGAISIGYGLAIGDVDGDGRPDVLLADARRFVWYRNPDWKRFTLAEDLGTLDDVAIAARDLDGDGKVEVAVAGQWNPGDTTGSGSLHVLVAPADRTERWTPIAIPCEPTVHRLRWVEIGKGRFVLFAAPLHGRGNRDGAGDPAKLQAYAPPSEWTQPWTSIVADASMHMTHNLDVLPRGSGEGEDVLLIGKEGARLVARDGERWQSTPIEHVGGGGEIRGARAAGDAGALQVATIEPMHGNRVAVYRLSPDRARTDRCIVLDESLAGGHALAFADLCGDAEPDVVAGWRDPDASGKTGIRLYVAKDGGDRYEQHALDDAIACEDLKLADLDGDGRLDVIAAGRATHDVKILWNRRAP